MGSIKSPFEFFQQMKEEEEEAGEEAFACSPKSKGLYNCRTGAGNGALIFFARILNLRVFALGF